MQPLCQVFFEIFFCIFFRLYFISDRLCTVRDRLFFPEKVFRFVFVVSKIHPYLKSMDNFARGMLHIPFEPLAFVAPALYLFFLFGV
mgnify:CR=1 FL=1